MPIENATFTASLNKTQTSDGRPEFFFKMKNASQLFYLDNTTYTYEGQRRCREMNCDVFISNRNDFHLEGYGTFNSTFEYYFLANDWTAVNNVGYSTQQSTSVPIRLDITAESWVGYTASYNIYNFDQEHPALSSFDITTCFNPDQRMDFRIDFPDTYDDGTYKYKKVFMEKIILLITQLTKISPIRVQKTSFTMMPDNSFFIGTLLEVPPPTVFYRRIPGVYMQFANDKALTTDDEYGCASQCNQNADFVCNSFDYCPGTKTCTLSKTHTEDGKLTDSSGQCDHFARTVNNPSLLITLAQAWQILRDIVIHGSFKIPMTLDAGAQKTYTASAITNNVLRSDTRQTSSSSFMDQFRAQINKAIPGYDDLILTGMAIDDCAAACINQEEWVCNSFEFHFDSGWCVLSKLHPDEMPNIIQNQQFVDLYIRKYSAAFNQIPGTTVLSSSDAIYQNIFSSDECAKLCTDYDGFNCKSFDFCDDISTCFLGKTHYYDVPKANIQTDPMCSHYSLKYLYDFQKYSRKVIQNLDDRIIAGVSVDQCAKLCVDEETFSCASFDYCGNVTECRLSTAAMKGVGQVTLEQQDWCDVYTRQTFPDGTPYVANAQKYYNLPKQDTSKKYTAGAMAGLAFAMLIIGVLLAGGILFGYMKYNAKAGDDMKIEFKNREETNS
ncbi:hypothetical protein CHS0354_010649 [Potamilus streckersoni]|uniref:Apple domain-containing protein n=1 Tax=Potamilus streckersoni TaxID=2493646 RepID=A0AAE0TC53_9BIVA|nr:hypothetical protein CHS0354_010649 [Potamilus streckersoni]